MAEMFLSFQQIQALVTVFLFMLPVSKSSMSAIGVLRLYKTRPELAGMIQIEDVLYRRR